MIGMLEVQEMVRTPAAHLEAVRHVRETTYGKKAQICFGNNGYHSQFTLGILSE